ncbi:hypothetical protein NPX13_g104 [Xylaria arbuscula]|uniref:Uncharacterized protein n=1 Tax=Xylaria arbuscula TaxID=114810 RepID=A0A9W8NPD6_9PEZI|nr:hypothetical protein NPX13_g104 [Xylaria arbuscula]
MDRNAGHSQADRGTDRGGGSGRSLGDQGGPPGYTGQPFQHHQSHHQGQEGRPGGVAPEQRSFLRITCTLDMLRYVHHEDMPPNTIV